MTHTTLALSLALLAAACAAAPPGPEVDARAALGVTGDPAREVRDAYDASRDAMADVDAALARSAARDAKVVVVLGANWCPDSRGLAWRLRQPEVEGLIAGGYELVYVDVGFMNRNIDVAQRFGLEGIKGTPTVLVLSPEGALLNADSVETWRTASQRSVDEVRDYFAQWAG
jgi:thiol-disulfide isomerase/thioredoxin